jgi:hypothetical protein
MRKSSSGDGRPEKFEATNETSDVLMKFERVD